uniref:B box-type domain-containing protein n=1 Tax=Branchiostoma floridae TaxID=7739 RepID=C3YTK4_BRAFL|eukprot:XP_002600119.1 hypothetical protein BRAFLDRAFT_118237 [Branchiostoma floridae]
MEENGSQPRKLCCTQCDGSDKKGATAAAGSCAECSRFLCKSCLPGHGTSFPHHSVFPLPPQGGYSQPLTNQICRYHKATPLSFYCNNCDRPICFKCAAEHHWKHQCVQSDQAAIAERASLATSLALAKHKSQEFAKARTSVSGMVRAVQDCYKKTLLDIYEAGNDYKKAIDQRVRALEEELTMGYYAQQLSLAKTREEFDGQLSVIQHREALFQHVLQSGSNVELLSHKKEISTQVEQLEAMKPHTCFKEDRFLKFSVADKSKVEDFLVENFGNLKACHLADHLSADATSQDLKPARSESSISSEHVISRDIEVSSDIPHVTSAGGDAPRSNADDFIPGGITMSTARPTEEVVRETKSDSEILGNGVAMATQVSPQVWGYRGGGGKTLSCHVSGAPTTTGPVWSHGGTQSGFSGGSNASLSAWEHAVNAQQVAATGRSGGGFSPSMPTGVASALKQILDDSDEAAEDEDITFTYAPYPTPPHPTQQVWRPNQQYYEDDMARHKKVWRPNQHYYEDDMARHKPVWRPNQQYYEDDMNRHKVAIDLKFGKWGDMEGYFRKPSGISVDSRGQLHVYIGRLDRSIECPHLKSPNGLALTSDGVIVVSDFWSPGAVLLSHDGRYLGQVGNVPSCRHPISVAVIPSPDRILIVLVNVT